MRNILAGGLLVLGLLVNSFAAFMLWILQGEYGQRCSEYVSCEPFVQQYSQGLAILLVIMTLGLTSVVYGSWLLGS